jgi:hypothetical protein
LTLFAIHYFSAIKSEAIAMQEEMSKKSGGLTVLLLLGLAVFLLIKFTFAGVTLLIALVALGLSFNTQNVITRNRAQFVAGLFGLLCVLNIYRELTREPATTAAVQLSPAEEKARNAATAEDATRFALKTINRKPDSGLKPIQQANCLMAIDSAEKGKIDWTSARDECRSALNQLNMLN